MVSVESLSSSVPGMSVVGLTGPLQPPRLAIQSVVTAAMLCAQKEGLSPGQTNLPGMYAVLGLTEDRQVLGLKIQSGAWILGRVPLPSLLARRLNLPVLNSRPFEPVWVRCLPGNVSLFRQGLETVLWTGKVTIPSCLPPSREPPPDNIADL